MLAGLSLLFTRLHRPRWPAGPRYDLLELAVVLGSGAFLLYVAQDVDSAAGSWLTAPGQYIAAVLMVAAALVAAVFAGYDRVRAATITLCLAGVSWCTVLVLGTIVDGFKPGSLWVAIVFGMVAQWARKTHDRDRIERSRETHTC